MVIYESRPLLSVEYNPERDEMSYNYGFKIIESYSGDARYLCYVDEDTGQERKFILPDIPNAAEKLICLIKKYEDINCAEKDVKIMAEEVKKTIATSLKEACDQVYQKPENYLKCLALKFLKSSFARKIIGMHDIDEFCSELAV